jgi:hypothetical protein
MLLHATHCAWPVAFWKVPAAHGSQLPESALAVPTLHAMHTPALAPPQPLRASPALPQPPHAAQASAPATALYASAGHASQCEAALVRGAAALALPREPVSQASQLVCPVSAWCLPSGHSSQLAAFVLVENVPAAHGEQPRFDVVLGAKDSCPPAAHTTCGRQKPLPVSTWYVLSGHASHCSAFSVAERRPTAQSVHALPLRNVPGLHVPQ